MLEYILHIHLPAVSLALFLDFIFGDPAWRFHPVRCMGVISGFLEKVFRKIIKNAYLGGFLTWLITLMFFTSITVILILVTAGFPDFVQIIIYGIIIYFCLAVKDLYRHGLAVKKALEMQDISLARRKLALMVSRDTGNLSKKQIIRATIESISENISDSAVAPVFYALLFGPVGAVIYRVINTLDAMFGYKNEKYQHFGFVSARMDDFLNLIPSRISGVLIAVFSPLSGGSIKNSFRILFRDSRKHSSPNSGFPEAAVAGALEIQIGGPASYHGRQIQKPEIGDSFKPLNTALIKKSCFLTGVPVALIFLISTVFSIIYFFLCNCSAVVSCVIPCLLKQ